LEYLRFCPTFGKSTLELLIPRIKLNNANDFEKMIMFCKNNGLQLALKSVLLTQGMNAYNAQLYTEAITCYIEAGEYSRINHIVYKLLGMYQTNGNIAYKDAISGIPMESLFKSPILSFLFRFIEFQTLYKEKNYGEAADLVVLLLTSGIAPKSFWKMLLLDALPLLEGQINVFTSEQVMELMRCVESCMSDSRDHPTLLKQDDESLNVLKLALNRSFAAALVCGK
jgi:nuclear pore complex protein Nup85